MMTVKHSSQFVQQAATQLRLIEKRIDNKAFSYLLGFNVVMDTICECKLYIRFFERDPSFLDFFEIFEDPNARVMASHDFHQADKIAFEKGGLGFKGFTIGMAKDMETDGVATGWGARYKRGGEVGFYGYKHSDKALHKKLYQYVIARKTPLKRPYYGVSHLTEFVEVQGGKKGREAKYCLCPNISRSNFEEVSFLMEKNLSSECNLLHKALIKLNPDLTLVNMGFGAAEEKIYYHNFKTPNQINNYIF